MDKPTIAPLPPAPNRSQAPAAFAAAADDFVGALPNFRSDLVAGIDYIEYTLDEVVSARTAAQTAASTAQNRATAAANSAVAAEASYQNALIAAAAAQAAAGLPALAGNAGRVLIVNPAANSVQWSGFTVGSNASGNRTISTEEPSGGADGDIWYQVEE